MAGGWGRVAGISRPSGLDNAGFDGKPFVLHYFYPLFFRLVRS